MVRSLHSKVIRLVLVSLVCASWMNSGFAQAPDAGDGGAGDGVFARENLLAWCIVPFDDRNRSPQERCEMLLELGIKKYAYDYRAEHVPTFDAEMLAIKKHGIELVGWWFPGALSEEARLILDVLRRHEIQTQLWVSGGGEPTHSAQEQQARIEAEAARIAPIAKAAAEIGCSVGLYNHGGWFGEPENQIAVIEHLKLPNVGIVYNLHHGHDHVDRFAQLLAMMKPHLYALNLNGMKRDGDKSGHKILPIGEGELDLELLRIIAASGYSGPIGILNHTQENAHQRLSKNLAGLDALLQQLNDSAQQPPQSGPSLEDSSGHSAEAVDQILARARQEGDSGRGISVFASATFACLNCHRVGEHGGRIGPELTGLATKRSAAEIVEAVFWPQRTIPPEYQTIAAVTSSGQVIRGYEISRDEQSLVIRDPATDVVHNLDRNEIDDEQPVGSLMPDGLTAAMTQSQQADLIRFLLSLGREEELPHESIDFALRHVTAHHHGPAAFAYDRRPLRVQDWPSWQEPINRDRIYDYYAKQAEHFRQSSPAPELLAEFPGLDGDAHGHWGNQDEASWDDDRWNQSDLGSLQAGVFRGAGVTVPRGVCVHLGGDDQWSTCFNPQTLSYEAVWTGGFLKFSSVRSGLMHGVMLEGTPQDVAALNTTRPAAGEEPYHYHGFYRHGDRVAFAYRIGGVEYLDAPVVENGQFRRDVGPVSSHALAAATKGGPVQWPQEIQTAIRLGDDSRAYTIDTIELPADNPWKSLMYVGDLAFADDGAGYICTIQGDVWRVTGLDYPSTQATWKRFASGLHHALGMVIDERGIFVLGRDQITRLHDLNGNGEADFYECFSSAYETSPAGHDFICGLQRDAEGYFYTASGNQGLLRISPDGRSAEVIATGLRNPDGLGVMPAGMVSVPSSEGEWTPASMIAAVTPGQPRQLVSHGTAIGGGQPPHFGYRGPRDQSPPDLPLVYLPRGVDNSSGGQTFVDSQRWGPLAGQMLHFSFGAAAHFLVLRDEVDAVPQGAVVPLAGEFCSGAHRGRFRPQDGQLYVAGAGGWGNYKLADGCLQRVRYTGGEVQLPVGFHVHQNGVQVQFSLPLDADTAANSSSHFAQCWNYRYGPGYGSPEFSTRHPGIRGHDTLKINSAHVSADHRSLFLEIPELQPVNQLHLHLQTSLDETRDLFVTVHAVDVPFEDFPGYVPGDKAIAPHPILADVALATRSIPNPWRQPLQGAREIRIHCASNLSFDTPSIAVRAGEPIRLTLVNPDVVPHNWALLKPGTLQQVGERANRFIADPEAPLRQYVPDSPDVLAYTDVVSSREEFSIYFQAPDAPGRYPYLCTFPGHWSVMNGEMIVAP